MCVCVYIYMYIYIYIYIYTYNTQGNGRRPRSTAPAAMTPRATKMAAATQNFLTLRARAALNPMP